MGNEREKKTKNESEQRKDYKKTENNKPGK